MLQLLELNKLKNTKISNENPDTPVSSPESRESPSDDLEETYIELNDEFIEECHAAILTFLRLITGSLFRVPNSMMATKHEGCARCGDRKSTRLNSSHSGESRMPSSA